MFGTDRSVFATVDHSKHRARRAPLSSFFSLGSVRRLQPMVDERVQACLQRVRGLKVTGQVINIVEMLSAFGNGEFCSGRR
jgi:hypothetical protein